MAGSPWDDRGATRSGRGRLFLVTLGVNAAPGPRATALRYAEADADAVKAGFLSQTHYDDVVDVTLGGQRDRRRVLLTLRNIAERSRAGDGLIFFYAGHGVVEAGPDGATEHFLTCDGTEPTAIAETALSLHDTLDILGDTACHTVVVLLDCCHSGTRGSRSFVGPIAASLLREGRGMGPLRHEPAPGPGRCVVSASSSRKPAHETSALKHGFFTYVLLEALRANGHESSVALSDFYPDVKRRCIQLTAGRQVPTFGGTDENTHVPLFGTSTASS